LDTEHPAFEPHPSGIEDHLPTPYWHVQDITTTELTLVAARGLGAGLGLEAVSSLRHVTSRIRFEDAQRRPFQPLEGDLHHRNETLVRPTDPWLLLHGNRTLGGCAGALRLGLTVPVGRTEDDPFRLGDLGLRHQHLQFGTGTWDPLLGIVVERPLGGIRLSLSGLGRFTVYENGRGYRSGHRLFAQLAAQRGLGTRWHGRLGLDAAREEPERWHGVVQEEEGNVGRTDVLLSAVAGRDLRGAGTIHVSLKVPVMTRARGSQLHYPLILSLGWSR
jgi:hypothetical protein